LTGLAFNDEEFPRANCQSAAGAHLLFVSQQRLGRFRLTLFLVRLEAFNAVPTNLYDTGHIVLESRHLHRVILNILLHAGNNFRREIFQISFNPRTSL
jgi:hypothetical protein